MSLLCNSLAVDSDLNSPQYWVKIYIALYNVRDYTDEIRWEIHIFTVKTLTQTQGYFRI